jgi:UDP-MurNAc hydroxylase
MELRHLQSSTQLIELNNQKILTDPWLTDGEYFGSWYHYPPFPNEKIRELQYDYIYVSHIHPDHLSEKTFLALPDKKPVLIRALESKFVKRKIEMLGFDVIECEHGEPFHLGDGSSITIYAADNCNPELCGKSMGCAPLEKKFGSTSIDTLALFESEQGKILNTNDCPYDLAKNTIKENGLNKDIDLLLVGYAGAGPYPQCFKFSSEEEKYIAAKNKEHQFLEMTRKYVDCVKPKTYAPFAGTYILGSRLSVLNQARGVPSLEDAVSFLTQITSDGPKCIHLEQFDSYNVSTGELEKKSKFQNIGYEEFVDQISAYHLDYDFDNWDEDDLEDLFLQAHQRFSTKASTIGVHSETEIIIQSDRIAYSMTTKSAPKKVKLNCSMEYPSLRVTLNHNLLNRLLRGPRFAHWNNAEIGSHLQYERLPNTFERGLHHCLCFFHQ